MKENKPREWWLWKSGKATFAYSQKQMHPGETHVIEYQAYLELFNKYQKLLNEFTKN